MTLIPLVCRICGLSRHTQPNRDDPFSTASIMSRCFDCGQKAGHDCVVIEYLDCSGRVLRREGQVVGAIG